MNQEEFRTAIRKSLAEALEAAWQKTYGSKIMFYKSTFDMAKRCRVWQQ